MEFNPQNPWLEKRTDSCRLQEESELSSNFHMCSLVECDDDDDDNDGLNSKSWTEHTLEVDVGF